MPSHDDAPALRPRPASARPVFDIRPEGWAILLVLPFAFVLVSVLLRHDSGPFWLWFNLDPDYFYLLDSLNLLNGNTPGHVAHPGTTLQVLGALVIKARHPLATADAITRQVLADPEAYLGLISSTLVALNAAAILVAGAAALAVLRSRTLALLTQGAPFLSMVIIKQAFHVKPEALLVFTTLVLITVMLLALRPGALDRRRGSYAIAFGIVAGFGVATKITGAPVFLLPIFLLRRPGALALYAGTAALASILFMLPAAGAWGVFLDWIWRVTLSSGVHGRGAATIIDLGRYPSSVLKMFQRPLFNVPLILSLVFVSVCAWRARRGLPVPSLEARALAGIALAQIVHVLIVAKHPSAVYLIPSLMLGAPALALLLRGTAALKRDAGPLPWAGVVATLLLLIAASQTYSVFKLDRETRARSASAEAVGGERFAACAWVYYYSASSPAFAFLLGDFVTGRRFSGALEAHFPAGTFWLEDWYTPGTFTFRSWRGPVDAKAATAPFPCIVVRGQRLEIDKGFLESLFPGRSFNESCSTPDERIFSAGVDCAGRLNGAAKGK